MKVKAKKEQLSGALKYIEGVVDMQELEKILSHAYIEVNSESMKVVSHASDKSLFVEVVLTGVEVLEEGSCTASAYLLYNIINNQPRDSEIEFTIQGVSGEDKLLIKSQDRSYSIVTLPLESFPQLTDINTVGKLNLTRQDFFTMLEKTSFAMAKSDVRQYINGVYLHRPEKDKTTLRMVATDSVRMAISEIPYESEDFKGMIIPAKTVNHLTSIITGENVQDVEISYGDVLMTIKVGRISLTTRLIDQDYANYASVVPTDNEKRCVADSSQLRTIIDRTSIITYNNIYKHVSFKLSNNNLVVSTKNNDGDTATESLPVEYQGDEVTIGFDSTQIKDIFTKIGNKKSVLEIKDSSTPVKITEEGNEQNIYIIMPIRS